MRRNVGARGPPMNTGSGLLGEGPAMGAGMTRMMSGIGNRASLLGSWPNDGRMQQQPRSLLDTHDSQGGMTEQRNMGAGLLKGPEMRDRSPYGHGGGMEQSSERGYYDERGDTNRYMEEQGAGKQAVYQQEYNNQGTGKYEQQKEYDYENAEMHFDYNHGNKSSQEVDAYREADYNQRGLKQRPDMYEDQSSNQRGLLGEPPARGGKVEKPLRLFDELVQHGLENQYDQRGNHEPIEPRRLMGKPHNERDIMSQSMDHHDYIQQERGLVELPQERGHVNSSREQRSHMDSLREQHGLMELPREQHGHMDHLREQRGLMKPQREQRGRIDPPRDQRGLMESPREQHGFMDMQREQRGLMELPEPPRPPRDLMDLSMEPRSLMDTPMNQRGLMDPSRDVRDQRGILDSPRDQRGLFDIPREQRNLLDSPRQQKGMNKRRGGKQNELMEKADLQMKLLQQEKLREHDQMEHINLLQQQQQAILMQQQQQQIQQQIQQQLQVEMEEQEEIKQQMQQAELIMAGKQGNRGGGGSIPSLFDLPARRKRPALPSRISDNKRPRTMSADRRDRRPPLVPERRRSPINRSIERQRDRNRRTRFSSLAKKQNRKDSGSTRNATSKPAVTSKNRGVERRVGEDKGKSKAEKGKSRDVSNKSKDEKKKSKDEKGKDKEQPKTESADKQDGRTQSVPEQNNSPRNRSIERQSDRKRHIQCSSPAKKQHRKDSGSTTNSTSKPATTSNDVIVKGRDREDKGKGKDEKGKSGGESNKHKDAKEKNKYGKGEDKKQLKTEVIVIVDELYDPTKSTEDDVAKKFTAPTPVGTRGAATSTPKTDSKPMNVKCITPVKPAEEFVVPEIYDSSIAVGQRYIVSGFFCKLCQKFYNNETATQISHCQSQTHYEKLKNTLATKRASGDVASNKSEIGHPLSKTGEESEENDEEASDKENLVKTGSLSMNESARDTIVINMNIK